MPVIIIWAIISLKSSIAEPEPKLQIAAPAPGYGSSSSSVSGSFLFTTDLKKIYRKKS
jgi:hypothetical protein